MIRAENSTFFPAPIKYKKEKLKKIILGSRFRIGELNEMMNCLKSYDISMIDFKIAFLHNSDYLLEVDERSTDNFECITSNLKELQADSWIFSFDEINRLKESYKEENLFHAWNSTAENIPVQVCIKYFPSMHEQGFKNKLLEKSRSRNIDIETGMFLNYMEKQVKLEADILLERAK